MAQHPIPPPEAVLIRNKRTAAPAMSMRQAARHAGISATAWKQVEDGGRSDHGRWYAINARPQMLAKMARTVGATPHELAAAGRPDAAAELTVMHNGATPDPVTADELLTLIRDIEDRVRQFMKRKGEDDDATRGGPPQWRHG